MSAPPRFDSRYRLLDIWRGFACVIVVLHHGGFALHGTVQRSLSGAATWQGWAVILYRRLDLGVPLFFVISGYCIAASMDSHRTKGASPWRFLGRRVWRIYPPYWVAVACFVAVVVSLRSVGWQPIRTGIHSLHLDPPGELSWAQWLGNLTLTETWRPKVFGGALYKNLTRISWTLCFEEQFYLVSFGLLMLFPRKLFGAIAAVSALILGLCVVSYDAGWLYQFEGTFIQLWYEFAVGLAVYWRLVVAESTLARRSVELGLVGLAITGLIVGGLAMAVVALFGLTLIALRPFDSPLSNQRIMAPFRACGRRCYSIYLIHLPICTVVAEALVQLGCTGFWIRALVVAPLAALAGIGAGWVFFAAVESRFHNPSPGRSATARAKVPSLTPEPSPKSPRLDPVAAV